MVDSWVLRRPDGRVAEDGPTVTTHWPCSSRAACRQRSDDKGVFAKVEGEGVRDDAAVGVSLCDVVGIFTLVRQGDRDGRREKAGDMTTDLLQGFV